MKSKALKAILKIKQSELDAKALAFAEVKNRIADLMAERDRVAAALSRPELCAFSAATAQILVRWQKAQAVQIVKLDATLRATEADLNKAEAELRAALGERRAVEKAVAAWSAG